MKATGIVRRIEECVMLEQNGLSRYVEVRQTS